MKYFLFVFILSSTVLAMDKIQVGQDPNEVLLLKHRNHRGIASIQEPIWEEIERNEKARNFDFIKAGFKVDPKIQPKY